MWLAIDDATPENGAMQVILGSHTHTREHLPVPPRQQLLAYIHPRGNTTRI